MKSQVKQKNITLVLKLAYYAHQRVDYQLFQVLILTANFYNELSQSTLWIKDELLYLIDMIMSFTEFLL